MVAGTTFDTNLLSRIPIDVAIALPPPLFFILCYTRIWKEKKLLFSSSSSLYIHIPILPFFF